MPTHPPALYRAWILIAVATVLLLFSYGFNVQWLIREETITWGRYIWVEMPRRLADDPWSAWLSIQGLDALSIYLPPLVLLGCAVYGGIRRAVPPAFVYGLGLLLPALYFLGRSVYFYNERGEELHYLDFPLVWSAAFVLYTLAFYSLRKGPAQRELDLTHHLLEQDD